MPGRNRLAGTPWHEEFHSVERKKEKAADCIYLGENRICSNKESIHYTEKCFVASHCKYREKEKKTNPKCSPKHVTPPPTHIIRVGCSLPDHCPVFNKAYGYGVMTNFLMDKRYIVIRFANGNTKSFQYPEAFLAGYLETEERIYRLVLLDAQNASRE